MKKLFIAAAMMLSFLTTNVHAIKMGVILGFTGPIESLTPAMAASAELAFDEAGNSGEVLGGEKFMRKGYFKKHRELNEKMLLYKNYLKSSPIPLQCTT